ncbi:MAG: fimbrillin family protein [Alistipes sp.]|nr:fimbrillin family protein [Alistipes sp.]
MRKSIIAILSLVAMVACTNDVTVKTQAPAAITFEDSFVEVKTRAAVDPSITTATIDAFDVWGFMDDPKGLMFDQQRVTKGEAGWTYNPLQYWTQDHNYYFYAVAPVDNADIVVNKDLNIEGLGTIDFTNTDGSVDLLYAEKQESTYNEDVNADGHETVKLTFAHLLSKVKFTFTNGFPEGTSSLKIENIKISQAPSKGTVTLNDDTAGRTWKVTDSNATLDFGHVNGGVALLPNESAECDNERLTIPADANVRYQIDFTATLYYGENVALTSEKTVYLEDQAFVIGKNYNITATIDNTNIAEDALTPIIFDVVEVEDWELGEHNGKIDFENDGTQVNPDEPVEEGYKLYFNNLANWTKVYAHIWANDGEDLGLTASEWPGRELTETEELDGVTYYVFQLPATATGKTVNVVFNDGAGSQTKDLAGVVEANLFFDNYVEPVAPSEVVLYLQPNANWNVDGARFAAYFFGNGETWVDMTLVEGETNIYAVTVPAGFEDVIFCRMNPGAAANNWNNKWNQTDDLKVPTDGTNLYTVTEDTWDKGGGEWSVYAPAAAPTALATPVVTAVAKENTVTITWEAVENAAAYSITVGTEMPVVTEELTYTFTGEYETEYTFNVVAVPADEEKFAASEAGVATATTEAAPAVEPTYTTVAEFLAAAEDDTVYTLKGTITAVANTTYGNFDLTDETGTVLIYGLCSPEGAQKYWAESGAKLGDDIVVKTVRTSYGTTPQGKNAIFVELVSPGTLAFWSFDATATSFTAAGGDKEIGLAIYNATAEVVATSDNAQFSAAYADGTLTITALENTAEEAIEGNITVTCGDLSQVVAVSQAAASSGAQTAVEAELVFSAANRTTFTTSQQVFEANNIKVTNDKGSSTSSVADFVAPARFYKNSKVTVTAPGNITTIVFDCNSASYATALKDSGLTGTVSVSSDKVTVTLDGSSNEYVISSLTGGQVRMDGVTVTYLQ